MTNDQLHQLGRGGVRDRSGRHRTAVAAGALAVLLLIGSVTGAQVGAQFAQKAKPEHLRLILAVIVLGVAIRMALGLGYRPDEIFTVIVQ